MPNSVIFSILIATGSISAIAFLSAGLLSLFPRWLRKIVPGLVALAAGTMLSTTFLHLLPESLEMLPAKTALSLTLLSFVGFLIIERLFRWHHCHGDHDHHDEDHRSVGYLNLLGDSFHNFVDGLVIAAAFATDPLLGVSTTIAVAAHELPQEIGDFGILLHSGFTRGAALLANFGVALTVVTGALAGIYLAQSVEVLNTYLLPVAAGSFLYIAAVDLVPEIHRRHRGWATVAVVGMFLIGLAITPISENILDQLGVVEAHGHIEDNALHSEDEDDHTEEHPDSEDH